MKSRSDNQRFIVCSTFLLTAAVVFRWWIRLKCSHAFGPVPFRVYVNRNACRRRHHHHHHHHHHHRGLKSPLVSTICDHHHYYYARTSSMMMVLVQQQQQQQQQQPGIVCIANNSSRSHHHDTGSGSITANMNYTSSSSSSSSSSSINKRNNNSDTIDDHHHHHHHHLDNNNHNNNSSCRMTNILYVGNLDWTIPMIEWEYRIRNLLQEVLLLVSGETTKVSFQFRNTTTRVRDRNKYHGGSVLLTLGHSTTISTTMNANQNGVKITLASNAHNVNDDDSVTTTMALQYLLERQQNEIATAVTMGTTTTTMQQSQPHWIVPLRIQYHYPPKQDNETTKEQENNDEWRQQRDQLRQDRAASYQRRRERVAAQTDTILQCVETSIIMTTTTTTATIMDRDDKNNTVAVDCYWSKQPSLLPNNESSNKSRSDNYSTHLEQYTTVMNSSSTGCIPILHAPALNWSIVPPIIDPAVGGGLQLLLPSPSPQQQQQPQQVNNSHANPNNSINNNNNSSGSSLSNRATRKRAAVEAFLVVVQNAFVAALPRSLSSNIDQLSTPPITTIADLGCGAGNLALPLAWWLNQKQNITISGCNTRSQLLAYRVLGFDLNTISLQRLQNRTRQLLCINDTASNIHNASTTSGNDHADLVDTVEMDLLSLIDRDTNATTAIDHNYQSRQQLLQQHQQFRICSAVVSLHACGAASDLSMMAAIQNQLPFAISPCCIGKTLTVRSTGDMLPDDSTDENISIAVDDNIDNNNALTKMRKDRMPLTMPTQRGSAPVGIITYPRSTWFQNILTYDQYRLIAAAADYGVRQQSDRQSEPNLNNSSNNNCDADTDEILRYQRQRRAKRIIEMDRLQYAYEHGYDVRLLELPRIGSWYTKREVLLGAIRNSPTAQRIAALSTTTTTTTHSQPPH